MKSQAELTAYARQQAEELERDMHWVGNSVAGRGYWQADDPSMDQVITSRAAAALEFLRQYAGPDSEWMTRARSAYDSHGGRRSVESGARAIGALLRAWADQVDQGIVDIAGSAALNEIGVVSTDVMTQVRRLLEDRDVHPAAPIVLAGAALETALRAVATDHSVDVAERPSMSAYAKALRRAEILTAQDVKDIEQCAGLRNSAAHGDFHALSVERAGLMEQQVNLLLRRLAELAPSE